VLLHVCAQHLVDATAACLHDQLPLEHMELHQNKIQVVVRSRLFKLPGQSLICDSVLCEKGSSITLL